MYRLTQKEKEEISSFSYNKGKLAITLHSRAPVLIERKGELDDEK